MKINTGMEKGISPILNRIGLIPGDISCRRAQKLDLSPLLGRIVAVIIIARAADGVGIIPADGRHLDKVRVPDVLVERIGVSVLFQSYFNPSHAEAQRARSRSTLRAPRLCVRLSATCCYVVKERLVGTMRPGLQRTETP